jgi:beta-lactam-binding protein with PASTA domain
VGESAQQAAIDLQNAGFKVIQQYQTVGDASNDGLVLSQNPEGGQQAPKGSNVTIVIAQFSGGPPTTDTTTTTG